MSSSTPIGRHPLERLAEEARKANERRSKHKVRCEACETEVLKDDLDAAVETAEDHDDRNDDHTITIGGMPLPSDELAEAAENLVKELRGDDDG